MNAPERCPHCGEQGTMMTEDDYEVIGGGDYVRHWLARVCYKCGHREQTEVRRKPKLTTKTK